MYEKKPAHRAHRRQPLLPRWEPLFALLYTQTRTHRIFSLLFPLFFHPALLLLLLHLNLLLIPRLHSASLSSPCSSSTSSSFSLSPNVTRSSFFLFFRCFLPIPSHLSSSHPRPSTATGVPVVYCLPSPSLFFYPEKGWLLERKRVASGRMAGVSRTGRRISRRPREGEEPVPNGGGQDERWVQRTEPSQLQDN